MGSKAKMLMFFGMFCYGGCGGSLDQEPVSNGWEASPVVLGSEASNTQCLDNVDNDGDGAVDCADLGCLYHPEVSVCTRPGAERGALCRDGIDNDGDEKVDCGDWDCKYDLWDQECEVSLAKIASARALRLATWNLKFFPKAKESLGAVTQAIGDLNPDVLAIQEVTSQGAFDDLVTALPDYQGVSLTDLTGMDYWIQTVFLFKKATFPLFEAEALFEDDDYYFPRPVLHLTLWRSADGSSPPWELFGVHLKAMGGSSNQSRRRQAIARIAQTIQGLTTQNPKARVIVLGDFNDKLLVAGQQNVFGALFELVDSVVPATLAAEEASHYTQLSYRSMIDHVFMGAAIVSTTRVPSCQVLPLNRFESSYNSMVSDHLPVMCFVARGVE
jgi:endonuclease/exonuclease/phosphatase family metal-dependent hydrolase